MICKTVMKFHHQIWLLFLIGLTALNVIKWGNHFIEAPYHPLDFRTYYTASKGYWQHQDPYNDSIKKATWAKLAQTEQINWQGDLTFPHAVCVYAPSFVWYFGLYNLMPFSIAIWVQLTLNILSIIGILIILIKLNPNISPIWLVFGLLGYRGIWQALDNGQPILQIIALALMAYQLSQSKKAFWQWIAGSIMGLIAYKFTFALPLALSLLFQNKYRPLIGFILSAFIFNVIAIQLSPLHWQLLDHWQLNLNQLMSYILEPGAINDIQSITLGILVPMVKCLNLQPYTIYFLTILGMGLAYGLLHQHRKTIDFSVMIGLAYLIGFSLGLHFSYDVIIAICFLMINTKAVSQWPAVWHWTFAIVFLPFGFLADFFKSDHLLMVPNIALFVLCIGLFAHYFWNKNSAIKKAN